MNELNWAFFFIPVLVFYFIAIVITYFSFLRLRAGLSQTCDP